MTFSATHEQTSPALAAWLAEFNRQAEAWAATGAKPSAILAREALQVLTLTYVPHGPELPLVRDELIPGAEYAVPVRVYVPSLTDDCPVIVFFHGGGHTAGSVSCYDRIARRIAKATGHIVLSAEYRLAPENPYPAGLRDAWTVTRGALAMLAVNQIRHKPVLSVMGDSAGGALAASVSHLAQHDASLQIDSQVLIYPSLDYTLNHPSVSTYGEGWMLTRNRIAWYFERYFQHAENRQAASPLHQTFSQRLPRTLILAAGLDPLRDEGLQYVAQLKACGVEQQHLLFDQAIHAYLNLETLLPEACSASYQAMRRFLNREPAPGSA